MTGQQIYDFTKELLGGREFEGGDIVFLQMLNQEKDMFERMRPWVVLRTEDSSQTATTSDTYTTAKSLPSRFIGFWGNTMNDRRISMELVNGDDIVPYRQIPFGMQRQYKDTPGVFYADVKNGNFYLCGSVSKTYTIYLMFLQGSADFSALTDSWTFNNGDNNMASILLASRIAMRSKGEIDYDDINERMVKYHGMSIRETLRALRVWDDRLQRNEQAA